MAPVKRELAAQRERATKVIERYLVQKDPNPRGHRDELLAATPVVRGLYGRSLKKDQWDWFTVWAQLGWPTTHQMRSCRDALGELRRFLGDWELDGVERARSRLRASGCVDHLHRFATGALADLPENSGFVYILSTREAPDILKIGFTERAVEKRVAEINRATGVLVPFGARAVWIVDDAARAEKAVHDALAQFRVRPDREFFRLGFAEACALIDRLVSEPGLGR